MNTLGPQAHGSESQIDSLKIVTVLRETPDYSLLKNDLPFVYRWIFPKSFIQSSQDGPLNILRGHS